MAHNTTAADILRTDTFHLVIRAKGGLLITWKRFETCTDAMDCFLHFVARLNAITEGEFKFVEAEYPTVADENGNTVSIVPTTEKLLVEILLGTTHKDIESIWETFLEERKG